MNWDDAIGYIAMALIIIALVWGLVECHRIDTNKQIELLKMERE